MNLRKVPIYPVFENNENLRVNLTSNKPQVAQPEFHPQFVYQVAQQPNLVQNIQPQLSAQLQSQPGYVNFASFEHTAGTVFQALPVHHPQAMFYAQPMYGAYLPPVQHLEPQQTNNLAISQAPPQKDTSKALLAKLEELNQRAKKYKCLAYLHGIMMTLLFWIMMGAGIYGLVSLTHYSQCAAQKREFRSSECSILTAFKPNQLMVIMASVFVGGIVSLLIEYHAIQSYLTKNLSKTKCYFYYHALSLLANIIAFNPVGIIMYAYLWHASSQLVTIFKEVDETKRQLLGMGVEQSVIDAALKSE